MSEAQKRSVRTMLQAGVGTLMLLVIPWLTQVIEWASGEATFPAVSLLGRAAVAFVASAVIAGVTQVHNWLEDTGRIRPVLKETRAQRTLRVSSHDSAG